MMKTFWLDDISNAFRSSGSFTKLILYAQLKIDMFRKLAVYMSCSLMLNWCFDKQLKTWQIIL